MNFTSTRRTISKVLDRRNMHCLLEFYTHNVPLFGYALSISDLDFRSNHQSLKSSLSQNVGANSHIIAMQNVIGREWFWRLHDSWSMQKFSKGSLSDIFASPLRYMPKGHCRSELSGDKCSFLMKESWAWEVDVEPIINGGNDDILLNIYGYKCTVLVTKGWIRKKIDCRTSNLRSAFCSKIFLYVKKRFWTKIYYLAGNSLVQRLIFQRWSPFGAQKSKGDFFEWFISTPRISDRIVLLTEDGTGTKEVFQIQEIIGYTKKAKKLWASCSRSFLQNGLNL